MDAEIEIMRTTPKDEQVVWMGWQEELGISLIYT
jgi:hypothetical protein